MPPLVIVKLTPPPSSSSRDRNRLPQWRRRTTRRPKGTKRDKWTLVASPLRRLANLQRVATTRHWPMRGPIARCSLHAGRWLAAGARRLGCPRASKRDIDQNDDIDLQAQLGRRAAGSCRPAAEHWRHLVISLFICFFPRPFSLAQIKRELLFNVHLFAHLWAFILN